MAYTEEAAMALEMITEAGTPVTVRRLSGGTYNPVTDVHTGESWASYIVPAVRLPLLTGDTMRDHFMAAGTGLRGDQLLLMLPATSAGNVPLPFAPQPGDRVVFGASATPDATWASVDSVSTLAPDNLPITHTLIATKGVAGSAIA